MQLISFRHTRLFKRGIWLSAAALPAAALAPAVARDTLGGNPAVAFLPAAILGALGLYFLRKTQVHRLSDQVMDCEDHLEVRRGRTEEIISFANVSAVDIAAGSGLRRIRVQLRVPGKLGARIEFLPPASLWSNPNAVRRVAVALHVRALRAQLQRSVP